MTFPPSYDENENSASPRRPMLDLRKVAPWVLTALLCTVSLAQLHAQSDVPGDPTSTSGDFDGTSTTGASYDTYTGNVKRTITDVTVPGTAGTIPLQFTRIYNSRANVVPTPIAAHFGDASWRHNYQWEGQITTNTGGNTVYQVGYPDGRIINFRLGRANLVSDAFARGPAGTADRFEVSPQRDPSHHYLHLADGSQVMFSVQPDSSGKYDLLRAERLIDPYGAATAFIYGTYKTTAGGLTVNVLSQIVEPGGRSLNLTYGTQYINGNPNNTLYVWAVITGVYWQDTQNTLHQDASYGYHVYGPNRPNAMGQTTIYCALNSVVYSQPQQTNAQAQVTASYTYYAANNPNTLGSAPPLLVTANDPFYPGPMHQIYYTYAPAGNYGVWGIVQAEHNLSTSESVSTLSQDQPNTPTTTTETRGDYADSNQDPISRHFNYGENTTANVATNAQSFQVTTATDFQGNPTYTYYYPKGDTAHGWGYVAQTTNASGTSTQYTTEPYTGKVTQVTLPGGRTRKTTWAGVDPATSYQQLTATYPYFVTSTTDERGQSTVYHRYGNTGYVYQIDYPDNGHEYFSYQHFSGPNGDYYKIASYQNKLGAHFAFTYGQNDDGQGPADLLKSVTRTYTDAITGASHTETITYTYNAANRVRSVQDQRSITEQFKYNPRGQITQVLHTSDPNQSQLNYGYDDDGNCTSVSDELSHVITIGYDTYRRITSVSTPVNAPQANGSQISSRTRWFAYDRRDNNDRSIGTATSHTASNWSVSWLPTGAAVQRIFSPNNWLTDEYDGMYVNGSQNPVVPAPGSGAVHNGISYNALGQRISTTDAEGFATTFTYDAYNRPWTATDPLGGPNHTVTRTYYAGQEPASGGSGINCTGLLKSITAPGADLANFPTALTQYTNYDPMGRLLATIDPYSHTFNSGYDAAGNLTSQSDGAQASGAHTTNYGNDQLGRKSQITYPDGSTEQWTYDASGNVSTFKNRAGATCTYQYNDGRSRCTSYSWNDGATSGANYTYYANGLLREASNANSDIQYTYDDSNALTAENELTVQPKRMVTRYTHDLDGNVDSTTYPNGNYPCFSHDDQERVTSMYSGPTTFSAYNYSGDRLASRALYNGFYTAYDYQNNGRVWDVWHIDGTHNKNISRHCYGYAPNGQISWFDREADGGQSGSALENGRGDAYYYWPDGSVGIAARDVAATGGWPNIYSATQDSRVAEGNVNYGGGSANTYCNNYSYDAAGNRSQVTQMNQGTINYGADGENRYYGSAYDGNGNTTNSAVGWTYAYDAENKMTSASGPNGQTLSFGYDAVGRMIAQVANGAVSYFYYAGAQRIEEHDANNNLVYLYFYDAPGSDQILFRQGGPWWRLWYQTDLMGNTTHLSAESYNSQGQLTGGYVVEQYLYDAYGTPTVYNPTGAPLGGSQFDNRYLFKSNGGYVWYPQAGVYYCRARFYLPQHGRFLQPDPIGQAGGLNVYAYCHNDPINGADPSGLDDFDFTFDGGDDPGVTLLPPDPIYYPPPVIIVVTTPGYSPSGNGGNGNSKPGSNGGHTPSTGTAVSLVTPGVSITHFPRVSGGYGIENSGEGVDIALSGASTYRDISYINDGPISADVGIDPIDILTGFLASGSKVVLGSLAKSAAKGGVPAALRAGQLAEGPALRAIGSTGKLTFTPTAEQIESAAFKVIVGDAKYTKLGVPVSTIFDGVTSTGLAEIKSGSSILGSTYQLRLQTYGALINNLPLTLYTSRPINGAFSDWLMRWGVSVKPIP